jgi:hypothetical protein
LPRQRCSSIQGPKRLNGSSRAFLRCCGLTRSIDEGKELLDVVDHRTRRWSRMGSLCQLLHEPQGFPAHGLSLHCSCACCRNTVGTPAQPPAGPSRLIASPMHCFCSAPASSAPSLHARGRLPCICTRLRKRTEPTVSPASDTRRAAPASTSAWVEGARRAWLHRDFSELVAPGSRLCFAAFPFGSSRHNHSSAFARIVVCLP